MRDTGRSRLLALLAIMALGWWWAFPREPFRGLQLAPLPEFDNDDYQWLDPTPGVNQPNNCGNCHAEIYRQWLQSGHARAATSTRVREVFAAVAHDRPEDTGVCAKCHAPTFRDPTLDYDLRQASGVDAHGVHCDYCHKIIDAPGGKHGTRFGIDALQLLRPPPGQMLSFGPLDDVLRDGEQFGYAPVYKQSRYCASCHEGVIYGIHVYGTYSEWLQSPARLEGRQCQTCHMSPTGKTTNIAPGKGGSERDPRTLGSHVMPGATKEMLKHCLSVKVAVNGAKVEVAVVADNVGHRVPTGFPDHHLLLLVDMLDGSGKRLEKVQGPHLRLTADVRPGKIYAKQFKEPETGRLLPFWLASEDPVDTRLFPGKADHLFFAVDGPLATVQVRLVYRRHFGPGPLGPLGEDEEGEIVVTHEDVHCR